MIKGLFHAAAGMLSRQSQLETVAGNLANVNTTGYKANRLHFRTAIDSRLFQGELQGQGGVTAGEPSYLHTDFSQGPLVDTRNPLDIAIAGRGFFPLETGETVSYTRNGNFTLNDACELVNSEGYRVMGEQGPIRIDGREVVIRPNGDVLVDGLRVAAIKLVDFEDLLRLRRNGYGYFAPEEGVEPVTLEAGDKRLLQGRIEKSNVDPVAEMVRMVELSRNYESCQKAIQAQDDTLRLAVGDLGR